MTASACVCRVCGVVVREGLEPVELAICADCQEQAEEAARPTAACRECGGSGAEPGTSYELPCLRCGGTGAEPERSPYVHPDRWSPEEE